MTASCPSRRSFLAAMGSAAAALAPLGRPATARAADSLTLGVQLYSLRGYKVDEALAHASDLGFRQVEFYPGMFPVNVLPQNGFPMTSAFLQGKGRRLEGEEG